MIRSQIISPLLVVVLALCQSFFVLCATAFCWAPSSIGTTRTFFLGKRSTVPSRSWILSSSPSLSFLENTMSGLPVQQTPPLVLSLREYLVASEVAATETNEKHKIKLILASQSPRRQEILTMMGLGGLFTVQPSPLDESALQQQLQGTTDPVEYTRQLATEKALALARALVLESKQQQQQQAEPPSVQQRPLHTRLVLGSDTIVAHNGHILEKPIDEADARRMLWKLQGQQHSVHTSVALVVVDDDNEPRVVQAFTDTALVTFASLSAMDIATYVATGEPMDKAGAYGIQGMGGQIVSAVDGDFFTVSFTLFILCYAVWTVQKYDLAWDTIKGSVVETESQRPI